MSAKSSADLTYEVDKGDSVSFKEREFRDLYRSEYSGDPSYVVFTDYSDLDDYGYLTAVNYYDKTVSLSESDLRNTWFYYDSRDVRSMTPTARIMCTAPWILKSAAVPVPPRGTSPIR